MTQPIERIARQRTLTDADIAAIAAALHVQSACNVGLTPDEVSMLKRFLSAFNTASGVIGKLLLTAIFLGLIAIFTKGFWATLLTGGK